MKKYLLTTLYIAFVVTLYHQVNIRLFTLDVTKNTRNALFKFFVTPTYNDQVYILNTGKLEPQQILELIDTLLQYNPKTVAINLCHLPNTFNLATQYTSYQNVLFVNCKETEIKNSLSRVVADHNTVTHFKTEADNYFELQLANPYQRGKNKEIINYSHLLLKGELKDVGSSLTSDFFSGKVVFVGYMGDYLTSEIYNFKNCNITPMNKDYGESNILPDMYETEISANISKYLSYN